MKRDDFRPGLGCGLAVISFGLFLLLSFHISEWLGAL